METSINKLLHWLLLVLENLGERLADFVASMGGDIRKTELDADFARSSDLLKRSAKGFCLDGKHCLSIEDSYKGALIFGKTGGGKSSVVLIPSCLRMMGASSIIVHDPSGEIAEKLSGTFHQSGYAVKYLNYTRPELGGFNPLARLKSLSDIKKVANLIVYTTMGRSTGDPFWNMAATTLLRIMIEITSSQPEEYRTMTNVVHLLDTFTFKPESIDRLVVKANNPSLLAAYKSLVAYDSKLLTSITATVKAATEIFHDPEVALTTAYDTIDFEAFREEPTVLFINNSVSDLKYLASITSILFTQLLGHIMRRIPSHGELPIFLLLDESSSLNLAGIMPAAVSNIRKHRAGILQVYQSYHQLASIYGPDDAKSIKENCYASLYLPGQNLETAKEISSLLGVFEYETERGGTKHRQLLLPNEVRELSDALLIAGNHRAAKVTLHPYYNNPQLRRLASSAPYYPDGLLPFETPPLIPLP
jgi:type IV secretory pathway TraG/TraD family ATPase VirD4